MAPYPAKKSFYDSHSFVFAPEPLTSVPDPIAFTLITMENQVSSPTNAEKDAASSERPSFGQHPLAASSFSSPPPKGSAPPPLKLMASSAKTPTGADSGEEPSSASTSGTSYIANALLSTQIINFESSPPLAYPAMLQQLDKTYVKSANVELAQSLRGVVSAHENDVLAGFKEEVEENDPTIALPELNLGLSEAGQSIQTYLKTSQEEDTAEFIRFENWNPAFTGLEIEEGSGSNPLDLMEKAVETERTAVSDTFETQKSLIAKQSGGGDLTPDLTGVLDGKISMESIPTPEFPAGDFALPSLEFLQTEQLDITQSVQTQIDTEIASRYPSIGTTIEEFKLQHQAFQTALEGSSENEATSIEDLPYDRSQFVADVLHQKQTLGNKLVDAVTDYDQNAQQDKDEAETEVLSEIQTGDQDILSAINGETPEDEQDGSTVQAFKRPGFIDDIGDGLKDGFEKGIEIGKDVPQKVTDKVEDVFSNLTIADIKAFLKGEGGVSGKPDLMATINSMKNRVLGAIQTQIQSLITDLSTLATTATSTIDGIVTEVTSYWADLQNKLDKKVQQSSQGLQAAIQVIYTEVEAAFSKMLEAGEGVVAAIMDFITDLLTGLEILKTLVEVLQTLIYQPGILVSAASEVVLGIDVTQPLPNEYLQAPEAGVGELVDIPDENLDLLAQETYSEADFEMQHTFDYPAHDDDLMEALLALPEGQHELGDDFTGGRNGIAALKSHFGIGEDGLEESGQTSTSEAPAERNRFVPDANGMVGPFTNKERLKYYSEQVGKQIVAWLEDKWPLLAGIITGALASAAALIMFGGVQVAASVAGMVLTALDVAFGIQAATEILAELILYIKSALQGNTRKSAFHLAKALCLLAFEVVTGGFDYRTPDAPSGVHKMPDPDAIPPSPHLPNPNLSRWNLTRRIRGKAEVRPNGDLRSGFGDSVSAGKFHLKGSDPTIVSGAETMDELALGLAAESRFKSFYAEVRAEWILIFGRINPDVLMGRVRKSRRIAGQPKPFPHLRTTYNNPDYLNKAGISNLDDIHFNDYMKNYEDQILAHAGLLNQDQIDQLRVLNLQRHQGSPEPTHAIQEGDEFQDHLAKLQNGDWYNTKTRAWNSSKQVDSLAEYQSFNFKGSQYHSDAKLAQSTFTGTTIDGLNFEESMEAIADQRANYRQEAHGIASDPLRGKEHEDYKKAMQGVIGSSEEAGELAGRAFVKTQYPKAKEIDATTSGGGKSGEFDLVYENSGAYIVVEAKGGTSPLGSRRTSDGKRAQQGSPEYFEAITEVMRTDSKPQIVQLGADLHQAFHNGGVEYYMVRQKFNGDTPGEIIVKKFQI